MNQTSAEQKGTVLIARNAYNWQYGGAEQFTLNMAISLRAEGYRPIVVTRVPETLKKCRAEKIVTFKNIWFRNVQKKPYVLVYFFVWPILIAQYVWVMLRYGVSVAILTSRDDQMFGTLACKLVGINSIWIDHGDFKQILSYAHVRATYLKFMKHAKTIVMASMAERSKITSLIPKKLIDTFVIINNGALRHNSEPMKKPHGSTIILYIGRIEAEKGSLDLMKAAATVIKANKNVIFWLVGKGRAEEEVKEIIKTEGMESNFKLWGHQDDIGPFLATGDIFVYPTHHDVSPLAPVEALLAGLPVVASNIGGIPEAIDDSCGILVAMKNPTELARAINKLVEDTDLRSKLKKGALKRSESLEFNAVVKNHYLPLIEAAEQKK